MESPGPEQVVGLGESDVHAVMRGEIEVVTGLDMAAPCGLDTVGDANQRRAVDVSAFPRHSGGDKQTRADDRQSVMESLDAHVVMHNDGRQLPEHAATR
jgi:hypothetical protein